jgi:thioredoxin reductase (NADPH)
LRVSPAIGASGLGSAYVVTPDEIAQIPLFAGLERDALEQVSRVAADISLAAGEYAAPQGTEQALFAVLEGRIEPIQRADGVERVVGVRHPGEIFGEVPITLGTVFPVGFRAAVPSRVMRIEPHAYHALAASAGCRGWPPIPRRRARSSSATGWTAHARSCATS